MSAEELLEQRADMAAGRLEPRIETGIFRLADHATFLARERETIDAFRAAQQQAFSTERTAWAAAGEFDPRPEPEREPAAGEAEIELPPRGVLVAAPCTASVWTVDVAAGDVISNGQRLLTLEAMKMETAVDAPCEGSVVRVLARPGDQVDPGSGLMIVVPHR